MRCSSDFIQPTGQERKVSVRLYDDAAQVRFGEMGGNYPRPFGANPFQQGVPRGNCQGEIVASRHM